ncbi:hypothetical protein Pmani_034660 [Petrolisthes manimaculis]|uniref:Peptidase C1A papain C-terminal domain-containing protein n=2 Tax=Petrolisthes manimaculis TaxID=1843537 RepID=A0AAE1NNY6_9EUCA|nr:hypothetical protein Pmani_034660 [Petrolisthes manimaculis]
MRCEDDLCLVDQNTVNDINRRQVQWVASNYSMFWGRKAKEGLTLRTGTWMPGRMTMRMYPIILRPDVSKIPPTFDPRRDKPRWWVSDVSDQGWCGASWVFSTVGVAQDRVSIHRHVTGGLRLSPQQVLSCYLRGKNGCDGGQVESAWLYMKNVGGVEESCVPYESGWTSTVPTCPRGNTHKSIRCKSGKVKQEDDMYGMEPAYRISGNEEDIQWEILNNGPVQAIMDVHLDFFVYRGGVYTHTAPDTHKGSPAIHSVRIIGWGVDRTRGQRSTKYWLVANSWGRDWGEDGFFRIRRGTNESQIESFILAVHPQKEVIGDEGRRRYRRRRRKHHRIDKQHNNNI